ncbi:MAG TPA: class I SAM-dependent DNA methyltransferase, partial [bacterium]|nr:class I SAM-dependent DNA methyltransferase [bacterium]
TAQSRFLPILEKDELYPSLEDLEKAFDVEVITKEFFEKYRDLFIRTKLELDEIVKNDKGVQREFQDKNINTVDFAKKLLGQIVFLYFLQKKGWFGVERGKLWGTGPKDFMRRLFNKEFGDYKNFYNDIFEPLFYEALRTDRSTDDHYYSRFNCKIPFLNGGLFDPPNNFDWVNVDILLSKELFSNTNKTKEGDTGDGILDIFDRYNFTVNEEEPLEKEVALDPELLGKIYEKLNAIRQDNFDEYLKVLHSGKKGEETKFNKEYGVYYTPREIVHYMCQESLMSYIETELEGEVEREEIEEFVKHSDLILENERTALEKKEKIEKGEQKNTRYEHKMPENIIKNAEKIDKLLADIKVCDPAVGSGAFPIGMMYEIVKLRQLLSIYIDKQINIYELKRHCIENSLYGVDIDPGAVEICRLRFWLSMIVDEEDFYNIKPLPNLDYKVVQGDSLLGVEENLFNQEAFKKLEELKSQYFNETNPIEKRQLRKQIDELISEITKGHKEFDFEVYFSEVFHQKGGFDIVIANPPYGNIMSRKQKEFVNQLYKYSTTSDIASPFVEKSSKILRNNGNITFIITFAITFNKDFSETRQLLKDGFEKVVILSFDRDRCRTFESMSQSVSILKAFNKNSKEKEGIFTSRMFRETPDIYNIKVSNADKYLFPIGTSYSYPHRLPKLGEKINIVILEKILKQRRKIKDIINRGNSHIWIRTSGNYWYNAWDECPYESSKVKELYADNLYKNFLIVLMNSSLFYLWFRIFGDGRDMNFDIFEEFPIPDSEQITKYKSLMENTSSNFLNALWSVFDPNGKRFSTSLIKDKIDLLDLVLGRYLYLLNHEEILHIMNYDKEVRGGLKLKQYETLANQILSLTQSPDYLSNPQKQAKVKELEREIDQLVYKLYNLTEGEIEIIEGTI